MTKATNLIFWCADSNYDLQEGHTICILLLAGHVEISWIRRSMESIDRQSFLNISAREMRDNSKALLENEFILEIIQ
jgi:uncharacterized membrane protein YqjE